MRVVISSATLAGINKALELSENGHEVTILSNDFILAEDTLGKFKLYSSEKEYDEILPWNTQAFEYDFYNKANKLNEIPLFSNQVNKVLLERLIKSNIRVLFSTHFVGIILKKKSS